MRRLARLLSLGWFFSGIIDQAVGLYDLLPERLRGWIEGFLIAPVVGVIAGVAFALWGYFSDLKPIYWAATAVTMGFFVTVISVVMQIAVTWARRHAFEVMPVSTSGMQVGIGADVLFPKKVYARISVTSKRDVTRCVALVTEVWFRERNTLYPQASWNPRYLSWTPEEDRLRTATLLHEITMMADLAVVEDAREDPFHFVIASADSGTRHAFSQGLYKIKVTVLSESGGGARRDCWFALTHIVGPMPGGKHQSRLILQPWLDSFLISNDAPDDPTSPPAPPTTRIGRCLNHRNEPAPPGTRHARLKPGLRQGGPSGEGAA
jgi:hypothetical protein